ncbi:hypothetical protein V473_17090 [Sphingobium cupriresistens LL01]|uniref:Uncharacterized protein n=1 Tax=Sphingobium cupriresistens LL01 TaxID=1420583 RepID=A0A0J7XQI5_9SPHN|nr:hypothetical protein V473_17090 [Sphingobium cupriresistens LL01]
MIPTGMAARRAMALTGVKSDRRRIGEKLDRL